MCGRIFRGVDVVNASAVPTVIVMKSVVAPFGTWNVTLFGEDHVTAAPALPCASPGSLRAEIAPTWTARVSPAAPKPEPLSVTVAPTDVLVGVKLVIFG